MGHVQQFGALGIFIGVAGLLIGLAAVGDYLHRESVENCPDGL